MFLQFNIILNNDANALESFFQNFGMVGGRFSKHSEISEKKKNLTLSQFHH
jgi:hypothetical protein